MSSSVSTSFNLTHSTNQLKNHWTFAFEKETIEYKIDQLFRKNIKNIHEVPIDEISLPSSQAVEDFQYVHWNRSIVLPAAQRIKPYSAEFSSCIALLARGFLEGNHQPSQLGLAHIWDVEHVKSCAGILNEIQEQIAHGKVEVFISGGYSSSRDIYFGLRDAIDDFEADSTCAVEIVDDQFEIANLGWLELVTEKNICHKGTSGLSFAGFDKKNNPFAVPGVTFKSFDPSCEKFKEIIKV